MKQSRIDSWPTNQEERVEDAYGSIQKKIRTLERLSRKFVINPCTRVVTKVKQVRAIPHTAPDYLVSSPDCVKRDGGDDLPVARSQQLQSGGDSIDHDTDRTSKIIATLRWVVPALIVILVPGYTALELIVFEQTGLTLGVGSGIFLGLSGSLVAWLMLTRVLETMRHHEAASKDVAQLNRQLAAVNGLCRSVTRSLESGRALDGALNAVCEIMNLEAGEIRVIDGRTLTIRSHRGLSPEFLQKEMVLELDRCLCGGATRSGQLLAVDDLSQDRRLLSQPCAIDGFRSIVCVPARSLGHVVGLIHLASRIPRVFTSEDLELLAAFGDQIGLAIHNTGLYSEIRQLKDELAVRIEERTAELENARQQLAQKARELEKLFTVIVNIQELERARIANDLHDGVVPLMVGALYETQTAKQYFVEGDDGLERIDTAQGLIQQAEAEIRNSVYDLRPPILDVKGLVPTLREHASRIAPPCALHVSGKPRRLVAGAEIAIYRIVQEALHNVQSHAHASKAEVFVRFAANSLWLIVKDDGRGFDVGSVFTGDGNHMGLGTMRQRAEGIGAELDIRTARGEGTSVIVRASAKLFADEQG